MNSPFPPFRRRAVVAAALSTLSWVAGAQTAASVAPSATVVITGNPLGRDNLAQPSTVLSGDGLVIRRAGTLGDTLAGLPGIATSSFGPQSARPVIRGLDGDRVRLLDNGGASVDASNLSFDHAVTLDPLVAERIEVLRGPAALLYGGNATGGVVNVIDNRIPRAPTENLLGRTELRLGGPADETAGSALLEGGGDGLSWHVDLADRHSEDLRVPRFAPVREGVAEAPTTRVINSSGETKSGAIGTSWADKDGYLGASVDTYRNDYGVTVEPDVTIRMRRNRLAVAGERRNIDGLINKVEFQASANDYQHQEVEGTGEVGTTFKSKGQDLRVQAQHVPLGRAGVRGVVGLQAENLDFSALGDEAFVPNTNTRSVGVFVLEEVDAGPLVLSGGVRVERVRIESDGDAAGAQEPRFGAAAERSFTPKSASLGATWPLAGGWALSASAGETERAPAYYELYANGVHVATGAYERGDPTLGVERSTHLEFGTQWSGGPHSAKADVFMTRFARYIGLDATGRDITSINADTGQPESVPEYAFSAVPARLYGLELQGRSRLVDRGWTLDATGALDLVRGTNRATDEPLPRLAPLRLSAGLEAERGPWRGGAALRHAARQDRVPSTDVATPSNTLLDLWLSWRTPLGAAEALWFVKLDNAFDQLAFNASAIRTARELAPQGGRALGAGVRVSF